MSARRTALPEGALSRAADAWPTATATSGSWPRMPAMSAAAPWAPHKGSKANSVLMR